MKKDILKITTIFLITVAGVFWALNYLFLSGKTAQKSKAAGDIIEVTYDPATPTVAAGQDLTIMLKMKPPTTISLRGYNLTMKFDKTILQAKYIDYKLGVPSPDFGDTSGTLSKVNASGTVNIQGEIQNASGLMINGNSTNDLVRIVFTATQATGNAISLSDVNFYQVKSDGTIDVNEVASVDAIKVNGGVSAALCTNLSDSFSSSLNTNNWIVWSNNNGAAEATGGMLTVNTPASTDNQGKGTIVYSKNLVAGDFIMETTFKGLTTTTSTDSGYLEGMGFYGSDPFDGFGIERLDNGQLKVLYDWKDTDWVDPTMVNTSIGANSPVRVKIQRVGTEIKFFYDIFDGAGYRLAKTFTGAYAGKAAPSLYVKNSSPKYPLATGKFDDFILTCVTSTGGVTPTVPAVSITPTGAITVTGNTVLNLKLKFQGITKKPADAKNMMNVKFTLSGDGIATPIVKSGSFVSDANGVWSGKVGFDVASPTGKKYTLYVKGPRHIQKKICENSPNETSAGTYRCSNDAITLVSGENTFDFSKVMLLSGDIYGPEKNQDGVVNSIDISYVKNNLTKTDAAVLGFCDINLDGKCDTQDYSLIISALSIKSDEL